MRLLGPAIETVSRLQPMRIVGRVAAIRGLTVLASDLPLPIGAVVRIGVANAAAGPSAGLGEVIGFSEGRAVVMMLGTTSGVRPGDAVESLHSTRTIPAGTPMLGRTINALGEPIDGLGPIAGCRPQELDPPPVGPMQRRRITEPLETGVRVLDLFTTLGRGQRIGVFAGPGVGKSTLLGSIARNTAADVNVIALVGERGREVRDFIEEALGPEGLARSVVVVATGDESPLMRVRAAAAGCAIAEHFRDLGAAVMLMMDSVTRFAHAQRQIGLASGEPPATKGYTPSVFSSMARLLERAGSVEGSGSITGVYTVLVEGDDMSEPVADAARGILDGHLVLSRQLAQRGHYPAVDVLDSVSRLADEVTDTAHQAARRQLIRLLAAYWRVDELVQIGAYAKGSSVESDAALTMYPRICELLQQPPDHKEAFEAGKARMVKLALDAGTMLQSAASKGK